MWFKNLSIYRLHLPWPYTAEAMAEQLALVPVRDPGAIEARSIGWIPPRDGGALVHSVNRQWLLALCVEERLLPTSIVKQFAADRAKAILENEGRQVGRKEMRDLREAITIELMPRAFPRRRVTYGWIDPINGWLVIDAGSQPKAEEFLEHLRRSVDGFHVKLMKTVQYPVSAMTGWVADGEAPTHFSIDQDLRLVSAEYATIRYAKHSLEGDEIRQHVANGKYATQLAMTWNDRISFVLTEDLRIKRLTFLDILKEQADGQAENEDERFDIDFTLMSGEVAKLLDSLVDALGGEQPLPDDLLTTAQRVVITAADKLDALLAEDSATATISHNGETLATFGGHSDPLYDQARSIVVTNRRASVSLLQRHLRIGYNQAARLIEAMEQRGVVSPMDSTGLRTVLQPR